MHSNLSNLIVNILTLNELHTKSAPMSKRYFEYAKFYHVEVKDKIDKITFWISLALMNPLHNICEII